jgi:hypothetical protein
MTIGLRVAMPPRPGAVASYALRVPRAGGLPAASFRPRLAAAALAVRLTVPVIRVRRGLPPPSECALPGAHNERESGMTPGSLSSFGHLQDGLHFQYRTHFYVITRTRREGPATPPSPTWRGSGAGRRRCL